MDYEQLIKDSNNRIAALDLQLLELACDFCQAKTILEIGSADGGSSVILGLKAKERAGHLYCIEPKPKARMVENMKAYGLGGVYTLIPAFSPWADWKSVPDRLDLLFIDGRHDLRWCLVDYHYWQPKVRVGGVIVFHDTSGHCQEDRRQSGYGQPGYKPLVQRAIDIILTTDPLRMVDSSQAPNGGAIAFEKTESIESKGTP